MKWRAMAIAPKDGSVILALHDDFSGVCAMRWGEGESRVTGETREAWFTPLYDDCVSERADSLIGWIPAPSLPQWDEE